ncbi:hypothetical protein VNO80_01252 [Phaseolus coccineus]|uniref:Uncharacterized protein n=1 Tax=Phaseolus coccineus TaxID=3886 RepID=A0AAN9RSJ5_PHACN
MLIWISAYSKSSGALYAAILFLTIGKSGQTLLDSFLENKVDEIFEAREKIEINDGSTEKQNEHDLIRIILTSTWLSAPLVVGYVVILCTDFFNQDYDIIFRNSAVLMGGCYLLFLFGSRKYRFEQVSDESNLGKIYRVCKAACGRRESDYPASEWLLLEGWLDKAAILNEKDSIYPEVTPDTQERDGKVCSVKDVREVKSLVPMIYLCFSFFAYSLLVATGNTFFVAQAGSMTTTNGYDISKLFLIKVAAEKVSRFICFLIMAGLRCTITTYSTSKRFVVTTSIIRIGFGMVCAVICCFVARKVEFHRLSLILKKLEKHSTTALVPQFILLGTTEALVEGGLNNLFHAHVAKSMWSFVDSYIELVNGIGKLFLIPLVLAFSGSWFKEKIDSNHLDRFYLMLGILNAAFLLVYAYYSFRYTYKETCPQDAAQPHLEASVLRPPHPTHMRPRICIRYGPRISVGFASAEAHAYASMRMRPR